MSNYRKRKKTSCDACPWKMQCKADGIVEPLVGTGEWIGVHFWIKYDRDCPIDVKVEFR